MSSEEEGRQGPSDKVLLVALAILGLIVGRLWGAYQAPPAGPAPAAVVEETS